MDRNYVLYSNLLHKIWRTIRKSMAPSKEQMKQVIAKGDNTKNNSLILNSDGIFELRVFEQLDINKDENTIVRFETLSKNTGFVGLEASKDSRFMDNTFIAMLECWVEYLKTKNITYFTDATKGGNEADLLLEIKKLSL